MPGSQGIRDTHSGKVLVPSETLPAPSIPRSRRIPLTDDDRTCAEAQSRLTSSGYPALRFVNCEMLGEVLFLSGVVPSYHLKQLAQALVIPMPGVGSVVNLLDVASGRSRQPVNP